MTTPHLATALLAIALVHTFLAPQLHAASARFRRRSIPAVALTLLGEVELVFAFWSAVLLLLMPLGDGLAATARYVTGLDFSEALFVFVVMTVAATRPVLSAAAALMERVACLLPLPRPAARLFTLLSLGPLLGSVLTEPAAMTVTALLLRDALFSGALPLRARYAVLGVLFVNVSIGGVLTHFAAPPVLMVADTWAWSTPYVFLHFGWKALAAVLVNALGVTLWLLPSLRKVPAPPAPPRTEPSPPWLALAHFGFLAAVIYFGHQPAVGLALLVVFLGLVAGTRRHQSPPRLRDAALVGLFLGGLVVLGGLQGWWLRPLLEALAPPSLFFAATALTAVTDNAALTYLGSQVPGLSEALRYALVAGAVAGGGLTVVANAPNPAGLTILDPSFGQDGIRPLSLFAAALAPTLVAMAALWLL